MKDRTLLAGLWGDYIVNDSDTDGHKLLMTLHSAGKHVCVRACVFDAGAAQQTSIVTLWALLAITRLKGVNWTRTRKPNKECLRGNEVTDLFLLQSGKTGCAQTGAASNTPLL